MSAWQVTALLYLVAMLTTSVADPEAQDCQLPQSGQLLYIYGLPGSGAAAVKVRKPVLEALAAGPHLGYFCLASIPVAAEHIEGPSAGSLCRQCSMHNSRALPVF